MWRERLHPCRYPRVFVLRISLTLHAAVCKRRAAEAAEDIANNVLVHLETALELPVVVDGEVGGRVKLSRETRRKDSSE